jgi:hypothetical protein
MGIKCIFGAKNAENQGLITDWLFFDQQGKIHINQ